jgi:hypothetical protein
MALCKIRSVPARRILLGAEPTTRAAAASLPPLPTSSSYSTVGQQVLVQFASRWRGIWLQFNARRANVAAVQGGMFNPLPQVVVTAQGAANFEPEVPRVRINKTRRDSTISTVTMNKSEMGVAHFPGLLNDFYKCAGLHYVEGVITVEVNLHFNHLHKAHFTPAYFRPVAPLPKGKSDVRLDQFPSATGEPAAAASIHNRKLRRAWVSEDLSRCSDILIAFNNSCSL